MQTGIAALFPLNALLTAVLLALLSCYIEITHLTGAWQCKSNLPVQKSTGNQINDLLISQRTILTIFMIKLGHQLALEKVKGDV